MLGILHAVYALKETFNFRCIAGSQLVQDVETNKSTPLCPCMVPRQKSLCLNSNFSAKDFVMSCKFCHQQPIAFLYFHLFDTRSISLINSPLSSLPLQRGLLCSAPTWRTPSTLALDLPTSQFPMTTFSSSQFSLAAGLLYINSTPTCTCCASICIDPFQFLISITRLQWKMSMTITLY